MLTFKAEIKQVLKRKTYWTWVTKSLESPLINMKNSPMTTVLLGVLTLSALASVVLCMLFTTNTRQRNLLQSQATAIINKRTIVNALVQEVMEYSKQNHEVDPILVSAGLIKPGKSTLTNTNKPGSK
jgi:L-lactate utilization protein LutC